LEEVHFFLKIRTAVDLRATEDELITFLEGRATRRTDETGQMENLRLESTNQKPESNQFLVNKRKTTTAERIKI